MTSTYNIEQNEGVGLGSDYTYLQWTTEPPTQVGWYWVFEEGFNEPQIVCVVEREGNLLAKHPFNMNEEEQELSDFDYWLGPLPKPNKP